MLLLTTELKRTIPESSVTAFDSRLHRSVPISLLHLCCANREAAMVTQQSLSRELDSGLLNISLIHNPLPAKCQNTVYMKFAIILLRDHTEENLNEFFKCSVDFLLKSLSLQATLLSLQEADGHEVEISSTSLTLAECVTAHSEVHCQCRNLLCGQSGNISKG